MKNGQGDLWVELGNQNDANPCFLPNLLFRTDGASQNYAYAFGDPRGRGFWLAANYKF